MKISLGPTPEHWSRNMMMNFYDAVAVSGVDVIYLGEAFCTQRRAVVIHDRIDLARDLVSQGKEVVLSASEQRQSKADLSRLAKLAGHGEFSLEINSHSALEVVAGHTSFVLGSDIDCSDSRLLERLIELGARRLVLHPDRAERTLAAMSSEQHVRCEVELMIFGRVAAVQGGTGDFLDMVDDRRRCRVPTGVQDIAIAAPRAPDINCGTALQETEKLVDWRLEIERLREAKVSLLRVSPYTLHTADAVQAFSEWIHEQITTREAYARCCEMQPAPLCDGCWFGRY